MVFEKTVQNSVYETEDCYLEVEKDMKSDPLQGLNVCMVRVDDEDTIVNFTLNLSDVLELHKGLTEYLDEVKQQMIN